MQNLYDLKTKNLHEKSVKIIGHKINLAIEKISKDKFKTWRFSTMSSFEDEVIDYLAIHYGYTVTRKDLSDFLKGNKAFTKVDKFVAVVKALLIVAELDDLDSLYVRELLGDFKVYLYNAIF